MTVQPSAGTGPNDPPRAVPNPIRDESHRLETQCVVCGKWDDHPKHSHADGAVWVDRHLDCCASAGCPNTGQPFQPEQACGEMLRAAGGKTREPLIAWLNGQPGKAHTARINQLAEARRTAAVARAGQALHTRMAEDNAAHAEHSARMLEQAEADVKELTK